jgi:murein DD-endopeptidase MepM/ murein hydrolase activator NlpD
MNDRLARVRVRAQGLVASFVGAVLPPRRIVIVSEHGRRSITMGTGSQLMAIGTTALVASWIGLSAVQLVEQDAAAEQRAAMELQRMSAQVQALKADTQALKGNVATTAERIEARQQFLDALLTGRANDRELADLLPRRSGTRASPQAQAQDLATAGVLAPFAALEQKQMALVDKASATAQTRLRDAETLIRRLGLDPSRFVAQSRASFTGRGGPFIPSTGTLQQSDGASPDPQFAELYVNWQRVQQLEDAMASLPAFVPAKTFVYTSGFGFRYDPFHGRAAQHTGIDMAGPHGEPIYAAANGRVVRAERFGAYGLTVDIDHGKGILTRYAHLSSIGVRNGEQVRMGQRIGGMGSTGRSTGTHLHYEVRIDGQPVNPRPFLESSNYILAMQKERMGPTLAEADIR